jgi:hypothetical protein
LALSSKPQKSLGYMLVIVPIERLQHYAELLEESSESSHLNLKKLRIEVWATQTGSAKIPEQAHTIPINENIVRIQVTV